MQIGKPTRCYPFKKETGDFVFIPYDYTEAELKFYGSRDELIEVEDYWDSIGNPKYDRDLSFKTICILYTTSCGIGLRQCLIIKSCKR